MVISPSRIHILPIEGSGNLASGMQSSNLWHPLFVRGHWRRISGSGTETATLTFDILSSRGPNFSTRIFTITGAGNGGDVNWGVTADDLASYRYLMEKNDQVILNWTNPDSPELYVGVLLGWCEV